MNKHINSIRHNKDTRAHIPSKEEAGYEDANEKVQSGKKVLEIPKNPVVHRGQDPELFWLNKYGNDDRDDLLRIDIRSLYRHEHIAPETLIKNLYKITETKSPQLDLFSINELFGNALEKDELEKIGEYYQHQDGWTNRLVQGDSHLVMASLLEREGMAGQVQTIYFDPPYGIKYGGNWQIKLNNRDVKDGNDEALTGEPEQIKAFRDTWELGIHSYLSYLRDRLLIAKELLTESGSIFMQIGDENVHLVRSLMDEVFGSENYISLINFAKTTGLNSNFLYGICDYIIWYAKDISKLKYRQLYSDKIIGGAGASKYNRIELPNGVRRSLTKEENEEQVPLPKGAKYWVDDNLTSQGNPLLKFIYEGKEYSGTYKTNLFGLENLAKKNRIYAASGTLRFVRYYDDFPVYPINSAWMDIGGIQSRVDGKVYVVQTANEAIKRCLLMTTDPGDLVLDPTCGSGTTAFVAEQWGRRWITIDTSRIAINIAKQRLMTATYPFYKLYDETAEDIRQGFIYKTVPHITLKSLAKDEPYATETLYDQPEVDKKKLRVSGPFTVETLQNFEPVSPEELDDEVRVNEEEGAFEEVIKQHLISAGIKNGRKDEMVVFTRVELLSHSFLHAEGFYQTAKGEVKAYFHIGPKFGTISKNAVNEAVKECRNRGDADWLVILGFSFESDISGSSQTTSVGSFEVTKARIHDDLLQEGLKKKPAKSAASFVTIGEPDIAIHKKGNTVSVEIQGLDIYDPIKDEVKPRNVNDIAYWMVDDDYDGSNFIVKQVYFCGGDSNEFDKWKKGLGEASKQATKKNAEKTLKIEIDEEAFDRLYGHISHPIEITKKDQKIAVRMISQFGEESTKVITV
ncbi:MAG: DNA methylase N-4/N-6 domain-containing protein [Bacteroidetes bacterium]|nr:MAG: DNA methylase N-4/N-6 domain-containing protein [Bacteroidota bacterium]